MKHGEAGGTAGKGKRFLLAGGGTGGHIYPALAIARELLARHPGAEILFIGGTRGLEGELIPREGFAFRAISVSGFRRSLSLDTLATAARAGLGVAQSLAVVSQFRPDAAIGTGGYASGPAMLASSWLGVPMLIHEQNVVPGAVNRMLSGRAAIVAISWEESRKYLKRPDSAVLTGNPVRPEVIAATREDGLTSFGLDGSRPTVLAFGGSQGPGQRSVRAGDGQGQVQRIDRSCARCGSACSCFLKRNSQVRAGRYYHHAIHLQYAACPGLCRPGAHQVGSDNPCRTGCSRSAGGARATPECSRQCAGEECACGGTTGSGARDAR